MAKSIFYQVMEYIPEWIKIAKEDPCCISYGYMTHNYIAAMRHYYDITREHHDMTPPSLLNVFNSLTKLNPKEAIQFYADVREEVLEELQESMDEDDGRGVYGCGEWAKNLRNDVFQMIVLCKLIDKRKCCVCKCSECKNNQNFKNWKPK